MIRTTAAVALAAIVVACSSSSSSGAEPSSCKTTDRHGVYRVTFRTVSGTCGDLPESNIDLSAGDAGANGCAIDHQEFSENNCKLTVDETCPVKGGGTNKGTYVTTQTAADGSTISGSFTITLSGTGGDCVGTYDIAATRL